MKAKVSVQYILRQIPAALDKALRKKSQREGKSINRTAIVLLQAGLAGIDAGAPRAVCLTENCCARGGAEEEA